MEVLKSHKAGVGGSFLAAKKSEFDMRLRGVAYVPYCTFFLFSNLIDTSCISLTVIYVFGGFDVSWMPDGILWDCSRAGIGTVSSTSDRMTGTH